MVVPDALGGLQPLCAVYRREVRAAAEQALQKGDYKIGDSVSRLSPRGRSQSRRLRPPDFRRTCSRNVNTAEEYEALIRARDSWSRATDKENRA